VKRLVGRAALVAALGAIAILATAPAALAKGPVRAVIRGPGLSSPITVPHGEDLGALDDQSGLSAGLWRWGCRDQYSCVRRPTGDLGPAYTVTYTLVVTHDRIVQYVYPYSSGGATAYVPAGQRFFGGQSSVGAWVRASPQLVLLLNDLGVPPLPTTPPVVEPEASSTGLIAVSIAILVAAVSLLALVTIRRGRKPAANGRPLSLVTTDADAEPAQPLVELDVAPDHA
jgi:hypothetical protein